MTDLQLPQLTATGDDAHQWLQQHGFVIGQYNPRTGCYYVTLPPDWSISGVSGACFSIYNAAGDTMAEVQISAKQARLYPREDGLPEHKSGESGKPFTLHSKSKKGKKK